MHKPAPRLFQEWGQQPTSLLLHKTGCSQRQTTAEVSQNIMSWHANPFERELRQEVRTMSHRIDRTLEDKAWCWTLHEYDRDTPLSRSIRIGAAEYRQKVRALAIPTRGRGNPALAALDDPSVAREPRCGANSLARRWRCDIGTASRFGSAKPSQRRPRLFQEWGQQPTSLLLRAADQERQ